MADSPDERDGKSYSLYTSIRRYFEPLRQHWDKLSAEEQGVVIQEVEAFLSSVRPPDSQRPS
ncbi:MAG: hypothetical protein KJS98_11485 [Nitrospirae bacterium]|nr:hypothetical protein [Nitrospirota bacterium]MDE3041485.1 hypothetical protein [Nitrospirota bacterium]MDE3219734.1 hypothetical protein [Nitrospirota bacterium]